MINRIEFIRNFGIFKNFDWKGIQDIEDFKDKNIFYGWNYSGKTTLSRLFSSLRDKSLHPDYNNASFKISIDNGFIDNNSLASFPYQVEVFNSDYIKDNLRWEYDENIKAIFFEVGDNAKISEKITIINRLIDAINGTTSIKGKKETYQQAIDEYDNFEDQFTNEAKKIKNDAFLSLIEFNKGHLKKIKGYIITNLENSIIKSKDELNAISQVVKIKEPKNKLVEILFTSNFTEIITLSREALSSVPNKSDVIEIFDKKQNAYEWAKEGLTLHSKSDKCLFCGNKIEEERYNALILYFDNQASKLKEKISKITKIIYNEEEAINSIIIPYSFNDFNENFQEIYKKSKIDFDKEVKKYKYVLNKIKNALNVKITKSLYRELPISIDETEINSLVGKIKQINDIIIQNNKFIDDFQIVIGRERDKYKNHLVASFLKESKYLAKEHRYNKALIEIKKLDEKVQEYEKEILILNAKKESDAEGCVQFNSFVQSFLSRDDIEIKLNDETRKFNLMRGTVLAQNLSEGEKMAISFSHFLVFIKSIERKGKLNDYIIFIDDPISSLDSNHVFQINSLLKEIFFDKVPNLDPRQRDLMWILKCKQLFVSTHNFEFFNLLKEMPKTNGLGKKESRYFISRKIHDSTIEKLPNVYNSYSSEYHYLFSEIVNFDNDPNKNSSAKLFLMPNILRRFVEMYTLTKYPSNEEVDIRADEVFGKIISKRIMNNPGAEPRGIASYHKLSCSI